MKNRKRMLLLIPVLLGVLVLAAVVVGILNATVADGKLTFGWHDYRYDESGYEIGEGTVAAPDVERIELDWIKGNVKIVPCDDTYISLSEQYEGELAESARVRWHVSEDGKTLSIRARDSAWYFGSGGPEKTLILRIPRKMLERLQALTVKTESASVDVNLIGAIPLAVTSEKGNVRVELPEGTGFVLAWSTGRGRLSSDFALTDGVNGQIAGQGGATLAITTDSGDLLLAAEKTP